VASKKGRQSAHNANTKKYAKQFARIEKNLKRKGKTNKKNKTQ
jgi:hypothetical protein